MSLLDLSANSLKKLFECLENDFSTVARLCRTAFTLKASASSMRTKPNVQTIRFCFIKPKFGSKVEGTSFNCEKYATHIYKGNPLEEDQYFSKSLNDSDYQYRLKCLKMRELVTVYDTTDLQSDKIETTAFKYLSYAFHKVDSAVHLELSFCQIDPNFVACFANFPSNLRNIRGLHLLRCQIHLTSVEFQKFLDIFKLDSIELSGTLGSDMLRDEKLAKSNVTDEKQYDLGVINSESQKDIIRAERHRKIVWNYAKEEDHPYLMKYELKLSNSITVTFMVKVHDYMMFHELDRKIRFATYNITNKRIRNRIRGLLAGKISFNNLYRLDEAIKNLEMANYRNERNALDEAHLDIYELMGTLQTEQMDEQEYFNLYVNDPEESHNRLNPNSDDEEVSEDEHTSSNEEINECALM